MELPTFVYLQEPLQDDVGEDRGPGQHLSFCPCLAVKAALDSQLYSHLSYFFSFERRDEDFVALLLRISQFWREIALPIFIWYEGE